MNISAPKPFLSAYLENHPLLALGFRPFYLVAAVFAVLALPVWMGLYSGLFPAVNYLNIIDWHSHEMIFGFFGAILAGFLLTAVKNWTGLPTPTGGTLAALAGLWVAGRISMLAGAPTFAALVDIAFLPALGVAITGPIMRSRNVRNYKVLVVVSALTVGNLAFHLSRLDVLPGGVSRLAVIASLDIIVILMAVMAGRVIPAFTKNAIPGANPRNILFIDVLAFGSLVLILAIEVVSYWFSVSGRFWSVIFFVAAGAHTIRLIFWQPQKIRGNILLLMLPAAYAWIPVAAFLRGLALLPVGVPVTSGIHAVTAGAMASLMIAMMTRSALGHSGRPLTAGRIEVTAYLLIQAAAITRVMSIFIWPQQYQNSLIISTALWSAAFAVFLVGYWPVLTRPRLDGKPG